LAKPGEVVIDDATRRLVGGTFEVDDLGSHELKGIGRPVPAWRVTGGRVAETRFDAIHSGQLTTFVGRENEINMLGDRWRQARDGEGQVVLLSGEAGIGKSRITQALRDLAVDDNPMRLRQQCAPYYTSTTLYPFIHQFEYAAGIAPEDPADVKLEKVEKLLALSTGAVAEVAPLIATLLAIPIEPKYPPLDVSPQQQMAQTLNVIVDQYIGLAARQPVLMIVEDVHWADPVSLDIIEMIIDRAQGAKIMVVITFRPEFVPNWRGHSHITSLALNRLGRGQCHAIIDAVTGGKLLPEELTKTVLESDLVRDTGDKYELARPLSQLAIPTTLQDSLMARLDRLAPVKEVAQMGAAIGREFPHRLLEAVSPLDSGELENALNQLVEAELIFRRGVPPETNYTFKHALVRDAAYESLLKSRRQVLHQSLADILAKHFPEVAEAEPEILAHHYTEAGMIEAAAGFWCRAGKRAAERWANSIAIDHLAKGLDLVATLPPSPERDRLELDLCIAYSPTMMAMEGFGSIKAERSCERARELSDSLDDFDSHFTATIGLWQINLLRGSVAVSKQYSDELWLKRTTRAGPRTCSLVIQRLVWSTPRPVTASMTRTNTAVTNLSMAPTTRVSAASTTRGYPTLFWVIWTNPLPALKDRLNLRAI
jgi:predicted ATPase